MRLYSTLQRGLVELPPPEESPVRMYFCGPTVYQRAHIGNARPFVFGMWLRSWLRHRGYDATLVHNINDVNDKIYDAAPARAPSSPRARRRGTSRTRATWGLGTRDGSPRATESIPAIVHFIEQLLERGSAYAVEGDVYFRVSRDPGYVYPLSGQRLDQMEQGEEPSPLKEDQRDFAPLEGEQAG